MGAAASSPTVLNKRSNAIDVIAHFAAAASASPSTFLDGKMALVTGGNSGLGLETVKALSSAGCRVIMTSRDVVAGQRAVTAELGSSDPRSTPYAGRSELVTVMEMDLESLPSIKALADAVAGQPLDYVIFNAGIMALEKREETSNGWEKQIGTNGHGHFYLASLLRPQLVARKEPSRVIWLSSLAHSYGKVIVSDLHYSKGRKYSAWYAYGQSKKVNMLHARELADQLTAEAQQHVVPVSLHPGVIQTNLGRHISLAKNPLVKMILTNFVVDKNIGQGAATTIYAALCPTLTPGGYYSDCALAKADKEGEDVEKTLRKALWKVTESDIATALANTKLSPSSESS